MRYPLSEHTVLQLGGISALVLRSRKLCMGFLFVEHMLLQLGGVPASRSVFQEAVHEISAR
jgi:hypothetical protein